MIEGCFHVRLRFAREQDEHMKLEADKVQREYDLSIGFPALDAIRIDSERLDAEVERQAVGVGAPGHVALGGAPSPFLRGR